MHQGAARIVGNRCRRCRRGNRRAHFWFDNRVRARPEMELATLACPLRTDPSEITIHGEMPCPNPALRKCCPAFSRLPPKALAMPVRAWPALRHAAAC
ncbi:hypothetical protein CBM2606_A30216 [Cupriavidus taiwanensis]|nr:hypothetical protein CBM2606_A30216 [Cupriavidus taiwanensis]